METPPFMRSFHRYELKQGILRLDHTRGLDTSIMNGLVETVCGIANVRPDSDGNSFVGVADKKGNADEKRLWMVSSLIALLTTTWLESIEKRNFWDSPRTSTFKSWLAPSNLPLSAQTATSALLLLPSKGRLFKNVNDNRVRCQSN
jgi:hypothetical protein